MWKFVFYCEGWVYADILARSGAQERVLGGIFAAKWDEVTGWRRLHNEELRDLSWAIFRACERSDTRILNKLGWGARKV